MAYFLCGNVRQIKNVVRFGVTISIDIQEKIIPFFKKYPILGSKSEDFEDFCKVAEIIKNGLHKTEEGLENIRKIKARMNRGRY
jgi:transcriptional regulator with AAA-type ATPase domain